MKRLLSISLFAAAGIAGAGLALGIGQYVHPQVTHADEQFTSFAGCLTVVPKTWGDFIGASTYGLAFQDDRGTLRFVQHPPCGSIVSGVNPPQATIDLEIVRK